jgi:hypothetical protein
MDLISCSNHNDHKKNVIGYVTSTFILERNCRKKEKKSGQVIGEKGKKKGGPGGF